MYIDSHSHIEMSQFDSDREDVIQRAIHAGVEVIVCIGNGDVENDSHSPAFALADRYPFIYTTAGVHPHEARLLDDALYARLKEMAVRPKVIAIGEIGLDYHYDHSPREIQREAFRRQIRLAREHNLPIVIHTREAEPDTLDILRDEWPGSKRPGVIHSFTGTGSFARQVVEMGFLISFSGVVTFKNAVDLRETARTLPLDRILIETDSPFLTPEPLRGKRNEPVNVIHTCKKIAEVRGISIEAVAQATSENFKRVFEL